MKRTISDVLQAADQRPSGFDYMRIILACLVVVMHSLSTSYGISADTWMWQSSFGPFARLILPMFFALSGFLVAGSMMRCKTIVMFLGLRVIRIYPALIVEVLLSALVIGPVVTSLPLGQYFSDPVFHRYLVNVTGHISFFLPGVFPDNPVPRVVNAQLWTVPYELLCYISLTACILAGAKRWRIIVPAAALLLAAAHLAARLRNGTYAPQAFDHVPGFLLVVMFLAGVSVYLYRERIRWSLWWGAAAAVSSVALLTFYVGQYLAIIPIAYLTVFVGTLNPRRMAMLRGADYSYGVFLYGYAIQQTLMFLLPGMRIWWCNLILALIVAFLFAFLSWTFVEKPALRMKSLVTRLEMAWLKATGRAPVPGEREQAFLRPSVQD